MFSVVTSTQGDVIVLVLTVWEAYVLVALSILDRFEH